MQQQTGEKENATYNGQGKSEETPNKDSSLVEREPLEGSPFTMMKIGGKYFIALGKHRLTEPTDTAEEQLDKFVTEHWNLITSVVVILVRQVLEEERQPKKSIVAEAIERYKANHPETKVVDVTPMENLSKDWQERYKNETERQLGE